jgi:hypothetical protein
MKYIEARNNIKTKDLQVLCFDIVATITRPNSFVLILMRKTGGRGVPWQGYRPGTRLTDLATRILRGRITDPPIICRRVGECSKLLASAHMAETDMVSGTDWTGFAALN